MARIRSLKPGFFSNEDLCELSPWHRLAFAGLWTLADRDGRLEDRPRRIKAAIFPYDELDMDALLSGLQAKGFVTRYVADGAAYLAIPGFLKHQRPKSDEHPSVIPAPLSSDPRGKESGPRPYKGQGTEDRGQRTEGINADAALTADGAVLLIEAADGAGAQRRAEDFVGLWNAETHPPIPRCREITSKRRRHIKARLTERALEAWRDIIARIQRSTFCRGENDRGWIASLDWLIGSPDVGVKVLEGKYDDRARGGQRVPNWTFNCPHEQQGQPHCSTAAACLRLQKAAS